MARFPSPFYRWRPHPWHGLESGPDAPRVVYAYVEITPFDLVKYDWFWGHARDIADLPPTLVERLQHYFATYKLVPGEASRITVEHAYGCGHALEVVSASMRDYEREFGT